MFINPDLSFLFKYRSRFPSPGLSDDGGYGMADGTQMEVLLGMPSTHNVLSIFIELHVQSDGILRATAETVVFGMVQPGVDDFLHFVMFFQSQTTILISKSSTGLSPRPVAVA